MKCNTEACHRTGDFIDLRYDVTTPQDLGCKCMPTSQGLHVCKVTPKNNGRMFGTKSGDSQSTFGGLSHVVMESDGLGDVSVDAEDGTMIAGVTEDKKMMNLTEDHCSERT